MKVDSFRELKNAALKPQPDLLIQKVAILFKRIMRKTRSFFQMRTFRPITERQEVEGGGGARRTMTAQHDRNEWDALRRHGRDKSKMKSKNRSRQSLCKMPVLDTYRTPLGDPCAVPLSPRRTPTKFSEPKTTRGLTWATEDSR